MKQRKWKVILQYVRLHIIMVAIYGSLVKDNYKVLKIDMNNSSYFEICTLSVKHGLAISSAPSIFEIKWASGALIRRNAVLKKLGNTRFPLRENCPNTEVFLVHIFLKSVRIHENTDHKKLRIWSLFTQCSLLRITVKWIRNSCSQILKCWMTWSSQYSNIDKVKPHLHLFTYWY